jgi:NADH dehydrogenase
MAPRPLLAMLTPDSMSKQAKPKIVVVGAGFGGLLAARRLARLPIHLTVVDRRNHHTFQPLLYQVATAGLSPAEIAAPVRWILRGQNANVLLGEVRDFDLDRRLVKLDNLQLPFDYLVVAAGASHAYFGHDDWAPLAPGLKTIEDALEIRRRVLLAFEVAERRALAGEPPAPLSFVIVGAGPTGVELAGTLAEIARQVLAQEFHAIDPKVTRVILLEGGPRVLPAYPEDLSRSAEAQLRKLGVEVRTGAMVTGIAQDLVTVGSERIEAAVVLWAAGVAASPLGRKLGVETDRAGRVLVAPDLSIPSHPEVFVIGDLAALKDSRGDWLPGVAPVAMQQGRAVARTIANELKRRVSAGSSPRSPFRYIDKGSLATIGRSAGIAQFGRLHISGFVAWLAWLFIHLFFLIGFRNRLLVMIQWAWSYLTFQRSARLITGASNVRVENKGRGGSGALD